MQTLIWSIAPYPVCCNVVEKEGELCPEGFQQLPVTKWLQQVIFQRLPVMMPGGGQVTLLFKGVANV